jgi:hypothetical protein
LHWVMIVPAAGPARGDMRCDFRPSRELCTREGPAGAVDAIGRTRRKARVVREGYMFGVSFETGRYDRYKKGEWQWEGWDSRLKHNLREAKASVFVLVSPPFWSVT